MLAAPNATSENKFIFVLGKRVRRCVYRCSGPGGLAVRRLKMELISKANFILNTRLEYVVGVQVLEDSIYIDMKSSASSRINKSIRQFMFSGSEVVAVFALRKNTSRNLLVMGTLRGEDVTFAPGFTVESSNGNFYRQAKQYRVRLKKRSAFNTSSIISSEDFLQKVEHGYGIGVFCPKMASGKMPYVRGLISLLGATGSKLSKKGTFNVRHTGCFVKIQ